MNAWQVIDELEWHEVEKFNKWTNSLEGCERGE